MAAKKTTRASRKPARAKATKKTSVRASRKAPGMAVKVQSGGLPNQWASLAG